MTSEKRPRNWRRWILIGVALAVTAAVAIPGIMLYSAWTRIDRVEFDPAAARRDLTGIDTPATPVDIDSIIVAGGDETPTTTATDFTPDVPATVPNAGAATDTTEAYPDAPPVPRSSPVADEAHEAILIIGSDRSVGGSRRADVIMLALIPASGSDLLLVSLPRDLYLDNPCGGGRARINGALNGCGSVSGPNLLAVVVEDYTGIPVDHFIMFDFAGFAEVIDIAGGIEVCVDHPTFDTNTTPDLELPAGCSILEGRMALSWVRSRRTQQLIDGVEQPMPGVGDHTRNSRQRDVVLQMIRKLSGFSNPADVIALANAAPGAFSLDAGLSIADAVSIAWNLRGRAGSIRSPWIRVDQYTTEAGAWVLIPTAPFEETIG